MRYYNIIRSLPSYSRNTFLENCSTASLSPQSVEKQGPPQITLDTTLVELYARGKGKAHESRIATVLCTAYSATLRLARDIKYLYEDSTFSTKPKVTSLEQDKDIQSSVAVKYLSLVPQHDAFAAGKMPVVLFNVDNSEGNTVRSKQEAEKTIPSLTTHQRLTLHFFPSP